METPRRLSVIKTVTAIPLMAIALTACGGPSQTAQEVVQGYTTALSANDIGTALEYVADPHDVVAENLIHLEGITAPEFSEIPEMGDAEDADNISVPIEVDGKESEVELIKVDGEWLLEEPDFICEIGDNPSGDPGLTGLLESGLQMETSEGQILDSDSVYISGPVSSTTPLNIDFTGNEFVEPMGTIIANLHTGPQPMLGDVETESAPKIADLVYEEMESAAPELSGTTVELGTNLSRAEVLSFPPKDRCTVTHSDEVDIRYTLYPPYEYRVVCLGDTASGEGMIELPADDDHAGLFTANFSGSKMTDIRLEAAPANLNVETAGLFSDTDLIEFINNLEDSLDR